jgi:hypothetical protein
VIKTVVLDAFLPGEFMDRVQPEVLAQVAFDVMDAARDFWIKRAGERLHMTSRDYINGIQPVEMAPGMASVALLGTLPNMVENGAGPFDMHDTLLGPNVPVAGPGQKGKHKNAKGGYYRAIPMRHQGPDTAGKGGGAPMGSQYFKSLPASLAKTLQADLGRAVYKKASRLKASTTMPAGTYGPVKPNTPGRLPAGTGGAGLLKAHPTMVGGRMTAPHSTDIYAGMIKQSKTYAAATQSQYTTFRIISDSVPDKWIHPGMDAVHLADEVQRYIETVAPKAILAAFEASL